MNHRLRATILSLLLALFVFRVLAQLLASTGRIAWLPAFEAWHSATLPYPVLVGSQVLLIVAGLWVIRRVAGSPGPVRPRVRGALRIAGWVYLVAMSARLVLGLTVWGDHQWFGASLPAFFHIVIACFVLVSAGHFGETHAKETL